MRTPTKNTSSPRSSSRQERTRRTLAVALWVSLGPVSTPADPPAAPLSADAPAESFFELGCRQLERGEFAAAVASLSQAVAKRPDEASFPLKLAEAYTAAGRRDDARRTLELLHFQRPEDVVVRAALANLRLSTGDSAAAVALLTPVRPQLEASGLTLLAAALDAAGQTPARDAALEEAVSRFPSSAAAHLARVDAALRSGCAALALARLSEARPALTDDPRADLLAARAYLLLDQPLGRTELREWSDAKVGQFREGWLLLEQPPGQRAFLCCPEASAMYHVRRALAIGLDAPEVHLLHARAWLAAGRPETARSLLNAREQSLVNAAPDESLELLETLSLTLGHIGDFLKYAQQRADRSPGRRNELLHAAFISAADHYTIRGNAAASREFTRRALKCKPDALDTALRLADAERDAGNFGEAQRLYRVVLSGVAAPDLRRLAARRLTELADQPPGVK